MPTTTQPRTWAHIKADLEAADLQIMGVASFLATYLRGSDDPVIRQEVERYHVAQHRSRALLTEPRADIDESPANA